MSGSRVQMLATALLVVVAFSLGAEKPTEKPIDFYGKKVRMLKLFGQLRRDDCSPGRVDGSHLFHAAGVVVDRSTKPNPIYVVDAGNSRILGFKSIASKKADLVFGQPDAFSSAPNGDCNLGEFAQPCRDSLCLMCVPSNTNLAEQWMFHHLDVDAEGNLYVADFMNNRVLMYRAPFSTDKSGGKGDTLPDLVLGQADFTSNGINRGRGRGKPDARSLHLGFGGFDHVASRGVSVDKNGNVWVADTFNFRVLRFPKGKTTADLAQHLRAARQRANPGVPGQRPPGRQDAVSGHPGHEGVCRLHLRRARPLAKAAQSPESKLTRLHRV